MPVRILLILMALTLTAHQAVAQHHGTATTGRVSAQRRAQGWEKAPPDAVGLDERVLNSFDADLAGGKYSLVDTFAVYRCGKMVFKRKYAHDYGQIYAKDVTQLGPLNARGETGWCRLLRSAVAPLLSRNRSPQHAVGNQRQCRRSLLESR